MADQKISDLAELAAAPAAGDLFATVDVSDTSMAASGTDKKIKAQRLVPMRVARSADRAAITSQTTPQSDGVLLYPVAGNSTQILFVEVFAPVFTANSTMDIKVGWSVPTGTTMKWGLGYVAGAAFPGFYALAVGSNPTTTLTESGTQAIGSGAGITNFVGVSGWIFSGGTSGDVNWQIAQNTSNGSNLVVEKGAFMRVTELVP